MKILVTGARGFVGKNLCAELMNISEGKCVFAGIDKGVQVLCADVDTSEETLKSYLSDCDFVFHLAGVNRPETLSEFTQGNVDALQLVLDYLKEQGNTCPVALSSSTQAELDNPYGESKRCAEEMLREYSGDTGAQVYIFRFPGIFGKWCRPNYNSVVATFCHNIANNLPIRIDAPEKEIRLVYIDDVVRTLLMCVCGIANKDKDGFCVVSPEHMVSLQRLADLLVSFRENRKKLQVPDFTDPFVSKLYATYLSYLDKDDFSYPLDTHRDYRGSFTEIIRTPDRGQFSVNISKPHITKGNHWHHTKNEKFCVVSGTGVIRFRNIHTDEVIEYFVSGDKMEVVDIPTGYTHNIENLGDTDMVTFMWASEAFDPQHPDTFFLEV
ncbi:MAG: SDR family oxidoreductase [Ruminococcaceae bacterium]|nr:SDR family oxidoreductase [Oscillospiraceae bacterium]